MRGIRPYSAWLWLGALLLIVAVLSVLSATSGTNESPLSLDSASPGGGLALRLWLERTGYRLDRYDSFLTPSRDRTVVLLEPLRGADKGERAALLRWVRGGGRLVVATSLEPSLLAPFGFNDVFALTARVRVTEPLLLRPPASRLSGTTSLVGRRVSAPGVIAATEYGAVLRHSRMGRGEIWAFTAPALLDNAHLGLAQNRRLAINLLGPPGAIAVDQPGPAANGASTDWLTGSAWGIAILFGLAVLVLYRWLGGWRLGPPVVPFAQGRRPAVEYVLSLASLLRRARQREAVLTIYQRELRAKLRRRFGTDGPEALPPAIAEEIRDLLQQPPQLSEEDLVRRAEAIVRFEEELKEHV
jgi:hypothetical protein